MKNETLATHQTFDDAQVEENVSQTEEPAQEELPEELNDIEDPQTEEGEDKEKDFWDLPLEELEDEVLLQEEPQTEEENKKEDTEEQKESKYGLVITKPLKYRGKEIFIDNEDEMIELAQKGLDYSIKMNKLKPHRKIVDIVEEAGLAPEDIRALADAKNGNAEAIKYLQNKFNIRLEQEEDIFDFDDEEPANRQQEYKPEIKEESPIEEIFSNLQQSNPELAGKVIKIFEDLDPTFQQELINPQVFMAFVGSISNGEWEQVYPRAIAVKASNPALTWLQAYISASQKVLKGSRKVEEPTEDIKKRNVSRKKRNIKKIEEQIDEIWNDKIPLEEIERKIFH